MAFNIVFIQYMYVCLLYVYILSMFAEHLYPSGVQ